MIYALGGDNHEKQILDNEIHKLRCKRLIQSRKCDSINKIRKKAYAKAIQEVQEELKQKKRAEINEKISKLENLREQILNNVGKMHYSAAIITESCKLKAKKDQNTHEKVKKIMNITHKNYIIKKKQAIIHMKNERDHKKFLKEIEIYRSRLLVQKYRQKISKKKKENSKIIKKNDHQDFLIIPASNSGNDLKANAKNLLKDFESKKESLKYFKIRAEENRDLRGKVAIKNLKNIKIYETLIKDLEIMQLKVLADKKKKYSQQNIHLVKLPERISFIDDNLKTNEKKDDLIHEEDINLKKDPNEPIRSLRVTDSGIVIRKSVNNSMPNNVSINGINDVENDHDESKKQKIANIFNILKLQKEIESENEKSPSPSIVDNPRSIRLHSSKNNRSFNPNLSSSQSLWNENREKSISSVSNNLKYFTTDDDLDNYNMISKSSKSQISLKDLNSDNDFDFSALSNKIEKINLINDNLSLNAKKNNNNHDFSNNDLRLIHHQKLPDQHSTFSSFSSTNDMDKFSEPVFHSIDESTTIFHDLSQDIISQDQSSKNSKSCIIPSRTSILLDAYRRSELSNSNSLPWEAISNTSRNSRLSHLLQSFTKINSSQ